MKTNYYFNYNFNFEENLPLEYKLRRYLNVALSSLLDGHGYLPANFSVNVSFGNVYHLGGCTLAGYNAFLVSVYDAERPDEIVVDFHLSILSDKIPAIMYDDKSFYSIDFEKDVELFEFEPSYNRVALSDEEIKVRVESAFKLFLERLPIRCLINAKNFPSVTLEIFFLGMFDPPDPQYVLSLLGFNGVLKNSPDPYRVIIDVEFEDDDPFIFYDVVNNLKPLKQYINHIKIT